nr:MULTISPECIES: hypothetical protein [Nocardia]
MDQRATGSAVAVDERVDRLELRVRDGGLRDSGQIVAIAERDQVLHQLGYELRRWWNEGGRAGIEGAATDPVLYVS